jgi:formamidopyrimidine-DNA glycosylase
LPELPEVETVRRGLAPVLVGATILDADIRRPDLRWPFPDGMKARLDGQTVVALRRRSKYLLADLSGGETLLIHLGMSGRMLIHAPNGTRDGTAAYVHTHPALEKHDHVIFDLTSGVRIVFNDPRRFGAMDLVQTSAQDEHKLLRVLGPEPLGNAFHVAHLKEALEGKRSPIKSALLDQRIVSGLGNIYVCEALHRAGISPKRLAGSISATDLEALVPIIRQVLDEAIAAGGSSLRDYRQADGDLGYFQHTFRVYGREGEACPNEGCGSLIDRTVQSGRSSFYCPICQR